MSASCSGCCEGWRSAARFDRGDESAAISDEDGFTLVEVVAALAILALAMSVLFDLITGGLRQTGYAERVAEAGSLAQSVLARAGSEHPLRPGLTSGEFPRDFQWSRRIEPYPDQPPREERAVDAFTISVQVLWNDGHERSVTLSTLRVGPKEPAR